MKIGETYLEHNHRYVEVAGFAFCKSAGRELPIVQDGNGVKRFSHPDILFPIPDGQLELLGYQRNDDFVEPPEPYELLEETEKELLEIISQMPPEMRRAAISDKEISQYMNAKAISLHQPWASLIAFQRKHFETRSWPTNYRGKLLICAAKKKPHPAELDFFGLTLEQTPLGMAVALATLTDCIQITEKSLIALNPSDEERNAGDWSLGRYAWKLENIVAIAPKPIRGQQGLWDVSIDHYKPMETMIDKDPTQLKIHPYNTAIYGSDPEQEREQFERLKSIIELTKEIKPLTIKPDGTIIKGNTRREVAIALSIPTVPCIVKEYSSIEEELLDLLADNTNRQPTTEQKIREALAWHKILQSDKVQNLSPPKGMKTRDWLGQRAGMSGVSFSDGCKVVEAIDARLSEGSIAEASLLRQELNNSIHGAKKLLQKLESEGVARTYFYSGEKIIGSDKTDLRKGDRVVLHPTYTPGNPGKVAVKRQFAEFGGIFEVYWHDIHLMVEVAEKDEYWRDKATLKIAIPQSPTEIRFLIRCDRLSPKEQINLSQQRQKEIKKLLNSLSYPETSEDVEGAIAVLRRELEMEEKLQQEKLAPAPDPVSQPEKKSSPPPVKKVKPQNQSPEPKIENKEEAIAASGLKRGDWVQDLSNKAMGRVLEITSHKIGTDLNPSFIVRASVEWKEGIANEIHADFLKKIPEPTIQDIAEELRRCDTKEEFTFLVGFYGGDRVEEAKSELPLPEQANLDDIVEGNPVKPQVYQERNGLMVGNHIRLSEAGKGIKELEPVSDKIGQIQQLETNILRVKFPGYDFPLSCNYEWVEPLPINKFKIGDLIRISEAGKGTGPIFEEAFNNKTVGKINNIFLNSGLIQVVFDGYETVTNPENLETYKPASLKDCRSTEEAEDLIKSLSLEALQKETLELFNFFRAN